MFSSGVWYDTDNEEVEEGVCTSSEEAGDMFVEQLLKLKYRGTLSAKSVCVLAYLAAEAEAVGPAKELGCRPAAGHFQGRIDDPSEPTTSGFQGTIGLRTTAW